MKKILKEHKRIVIAGTAAVAVVLGAGLFVPVRIEVSQTGKLHQHAALTEKDFEVRASTLFGLKYNAADYKVSWNGWTDEQQSTLLDKIEQSKNDGERPEGIEAFADNGGANAADATSKDTAGPEETRQQVENNTSQTGSDDLVVTGDTVTEYTISQGNLTDQVKADVIPVREIRASYNEPIYYMEVPDPEEIRAYLVYEDGMEAEIPCTVPEMGKCTEETDIHVQTEFGDAVCHLVPIMPSELSAEYKAKVYTGEEAKAEEVRITVTFADGYTKKTKAKEFTEDAFVNESGDYHVSCAYGETDVHIDPVPITGAGIEVKEQLYEEDMLEFDEITLTFEDGKQKVVSKDEVEMGAEAQLPLTAGKNEIPFLYHGKMYTFTVDVLHDNEIRRARIRYAEEIETAEYSHLTDTIMVTVNRYTEGAYSYLLTHIIIDDPSQIHAGLSNDDYGGERETPSSASERLGWVVGINGSNFDYATNTPTMADAIIKNGQVMPDSKMTANGMEICLTESGNLFSPKQGMTVNDLLNMGVTDTWCCGDTLLISNGEPVNVGIQSLDYRYPRTAIGMVRPCEYYLITAGSAGYENGMTYDEIRDTLIAHDCGFGKCLDGGGSSTLIFENKMLNSPATGSERPVTDFLYFTE